MAKVMKMMKCQRKDGPMSYSIFFDHDKIAMGPAMGVSIERVKEIIDKARAKKGEFVNSSRGLEAMLDECNSLNEALFCAFIVGFEAAMRTTDEQRESFKENLKKSGGNWL